MPLRHRSFTVPRRLSKLSVEKALKKLRENDARSKKLVARRKVDALNEEIKRMRAQRLRLDRQSSKRD